MLKSSSMRWRRLLSSMARVLPAGAPSTRMELSLMATSGASTMSSTFSAFGRWTPLAGGTSPDALNVMRRKTTTTMRKSIIEVSDRPALVARRPWPAAFSRTNFSLMKCIKRLPGCWTLISIHREGHVECRNVFRLAAHQHRAVLGVDRVDHADDVDVLRLVVGVEDALIELRIALIAVRAVGRPLFLDLLGEIGVADFLGVRRGVLFEIVTSRNVDRVHDRRTLFPHQHELVGLAQLDVKNLFGRLLLLFGIGPRRTRHLRVCIQTRHVRPNGGDEEEGDGDHQEVDERDHVDLRIERPPLPSAAAAYVYAGHRSLPQAAAGTPDRLTFCRLFTTRLRTWTLASLMSSSSDCVLPLRTAKPTSAMMATIKPKAVQFIASEIPSARMRAFWLGSTLSPDTAPKLWIRPETVPSRPQSIARFASRARNPVRFAIFGISRSAASSIAAWTSSSGRLTFTRPA